MDMSSLKSMIGLSIAVGITVLCAFSADARSISARGSRGAAGGFAHQGQSGSIAAAGARSYGRGAAGGIVGSGKTSRGGTITGAGIGFATPQRGAFAGGYHGTTAAGSTYNGGAAGAWKKGTGGAFGSSMNATSANGSAYSSYKRGGYSAATAQGQYNSGKTYTNAETGNQYGYDQSTSFVKGQGGTTTLDTQNKGDYTVDWQKGQKPLVTQTSPPTGKTQSPTTYAAPPTYSSAPTTYAAPPTYSSAPPSNTTNIYAVPPTNYTTVPTSTNTYPPSYPYTAPPLVVPVPILLPSDTTSQSGSNTSNTVYQSPTEAPVVSESQLMSSPIATEQPVQAGQPAPAAAPPNASPPTYKNRQNARQRIRQARRALYSAQTNLPEPVSTPGH